MSEPKIVINIDSQTFKYLNGDYSGLSYFRQHNPSYYADDPNDMEVLEEVKEDKQ